MAAALPHNGIDRQLPTITAYANDVSYDSVFVEQLRNFAQPSDLVMGISGWWQQIANWPGFRPRSTRTERDSHRSSEHTRKARWANFTKLAAGIWQVHEEPDPTPRRGVRSRQ
jgi:hypothetical protein